ncbi:MAG TPA: hypothetical protein VM695_04825 [Phycisphaerae bacterium]|nr:hypothetical protein [Phycisphaerae bacterium]
MTEPTTPPELPRPPELPHGHSHPGHDPDPGHAHGGDGPEAFADPASQHLAEALRTSFRLLAGVMVLGVLAFLAMGFRFVRPGEAALHRVFGRVVGVTSEGLAYNWPSPIGTIEKVNVGERTITLDEFWMNETKKDRLQPDLRKRDAPAGGLRPGWDGAALTGDRALLHMRLKCTYVIARTGYELPFGDPLVADDPVVEFIRRSPGAGETVAAARLRWRREHPESPEPPSQLAKADPDEPLRAAAGEMTFLCGVPPVLLFRLNLADGEEAIRSALCNAGLRAAAIRTADGLQGTERSAFEKDVRQIAQQRLDELRSGVEVRAVKVVDSTWPLRTLPDYDAVQIAVNRAEELRNTARGDAVTIVHGAVGPEAAEMLVGDPRDIGMPPSARAPEEPGRETNLIGRYNQAVRDGDEAAAAGLLERIDNVLVSDATQATARQMFTDARSYRTATIERVKERLKNFKGLLSAYRSNPQFALNRWWVEAREEILNYPTAEKHYITPGEGRTVLRINRDGDIVREIDKALLKEKSQEAGGGSSPPQK